MGTPDITAAEQALHTDGVFGQQGVFSRDWAAELDEDLRTLFQEAIRSPDGALGRGPRRYYVEIHPERLRGFRDIATNPWLTGVCERVLGIRGESSLPLLRRPRERVVHRRPATVLLVTLEHREVVDPEEGEDLVVDQAELAAEMEPERTEYA